MKKLRPWIHLMLFFAMMTTSIHGQEICNQEEDQSYLQENESCCEAYMESSHTAHWSVYVPLTILVAAAIYFGMADKKNHEHPSSGSQDALGSIVNSKRIGSMKSSSGSYKSYNPSRCRTGYQHS